MNNFVKSIKIKEELNNILISINVYLDSNFKSISNSEIKWKKNDGFIKIKNTFTTKKEVVFWDNLDFFIKSDKGEIKKECKEELIKKELYTKGVFKVIKKMVQELIDAGYLEKVQLVEE